MSYNELLQKQRVVKQFLLDHDIPLDIVNTIVGEMALSHFNQLHDEVVHYQRMNVEADECVLHVDKLMAAANGEVITHEFMDIQKHSG